MADNLALDWAARHASELLCLYCLDPNTEVANSYQTASLGEKRKAFILASLKQLSQSLALLGQKLIIINSPAYQIIPKLVEQFNIETVLTSRHAGFYEQQQWQTIQQTLSKRQIKNTKSIAFYQFDNASLFSESELNFPLHKLPDTFSKARKQFEKLTIRSELLAPQQLPRPLQAKVVADDSLDISQIDGNALVPLNIQGGEAAGQNHLKHYFSDDKAHSYKSLRNELSGWHNSTKFSFWLAHGCLSPVQIFYALKQFESVNGESESSYWIYFELLWREYFYWYAHKYQSKLYAFSGISKKSPKTSFYPARFNQWRYGTTRYPIVNACMKSLKATGYLSNRGRQIAASCLVNELEVDWRYGAAWFEHCLIDYEVASNWGNWQYIAGVGADPRGGRHFHLAKQTEIYDPHSIFINHWQATTYIENETDMVDWPLTGSDHD